jgi:hypothetical protein
MQHNDIALPVRIPAECKRWLEQESNFAGRSQNSLVVQAIRELMTRTTGVAPMTPEPAPVPKLPSGKDIANAVKKGVAEALAATETA